MMNKEQIQKATQAHKLLEELKENGIEMALEDTNEPNYKATQGCMLTIIVFLLGIICASMVFITYIMTNFIL